MCVGPVGGKGGRGGHLKVYFISLDEAKHRTKNNNNDISNNENTPDINHPPCALYKDIPFIASFASVLRWMRRK